MNEAYRLPTFVLQVAGGLGLEHQVDAVGRQGVADTVPVDVAHVLVHDARPLLILKRLAVLRLGRNDRPCPMLSRTSRRRSGRHRLTVSRVHRQCFVRTTLVPLRNVDGPQPPVLWWAIGLPWGVPRRSVSAARAGL